MIGNGGWKKANIGNEVFTNTGAIIGGAATTGTINSTMSQCSVCYIWYMGSNHICGYQYPYIGQGSITLGGYYHKALTSYTLQELFDELKRRQFQQDVKVKELEREVELQKQLDLMFPKETK